MKAGPGRGGRYPESGYMMKAIRKLNFIGWIIQFFLWSQLSGFQAICLCNHAPGQACRSSFHKNIKENCCAAAALPAESEPAEPAGCHSSPAASPADEPAACSPGHSQAGKNYPVAPQSLYWCAAACLTGVPEQSRALPAAEQLKKIPLLFAGNIIPGIPGTFPGQFSISVPFNNPLNHSSPPLYLIHQVFLI